MSFNPFTGLALTPEARTFISQHSDAEIMALLLGASLEATGATAVQRTITVSTVTTGGTVAEGKVGIEFMFSSDFLGTIDGEAFTGTNDASWSPPPLPRGDTYGALAYTITAGSARLTILA